MCWVYSDLTENVTENIFGNVFKDDYSFIILGRENEYEEEISIPIAVQFLKQSHGQIDWGAMMAVLVLAILPIIIFYVACQKYIIEGVLAGAVKG